VPCEKGSKGVRKKNEVRIRPRPAQGNRERKRSAPGTFTGGSGDIAAGKKAGGKGERRGFSRWKKGLTGGRKKDTARKREKGSRHPRERRNEKKGDLHDERTPRRGGGRVRLSHCQTKGKLKSAMTEGGKKGGSQQGRKKHLPEKGHARKGDVDGLVREKKEENHGKKE